MNDQTKYNLNVDLSDHPVLVNDLNMVKQSEPEFEIGDASKCVQQQEIITPVIEQPISFIQLFRFASPFDKSLIVISAICAAFSGVCFPVTIIFFGKITNAFITKEYTDDEIISIRCNRTDPTHWFEQM